MSRIAKAPVDVVSGVEVSISGQEVTVKGSKGTLTRVFNDAVEVAQEENQLKALPREGFVDGWAQAGTARSILNAMVQGVSEGFEKKLQLLGVGYRAQAQGNKLNLTLGFSHPVAYEMLKALRLKLLAKLKSSLKAPISRWLVRLRRTFVVTVHQSLTKVKVYVTLTNTYVVKKLRKSRWVIRWIRKQLAFVALLAHEQKFVNWPRIAW